MANRGGRLATQTEARSFLQGRKLAGQTSWVAVGISNDRDWVHIGDESSISPTDFYKQENSGNEPSWHLDAGIQPTNNVYGLIVKENPQISKAMIFNKDVKCDPSELASILISTATYASSQA